MKKNSVIMVLDCGGGTVDITVHKLLCNQNEKFLCEELLPSSGGSEWGSKFVDNHFEIFMEKFLGNELYTFYKKNAIARLGILKHLKFSKESFVQGKMKDLAYN